MKKLFILCLLAFAAALPAAQLIVFNSESLLDEASNPQEGTNITGDMLQMLFPGPNGTADPPDIFGGPGGDDFYIPVSAGDVTPWSGANEPALNWDQGLFNETFTIDSGLVGENFFVRLWNAVNPVSSTHYGDTDIFAIPTEPGVGAIFLDVVPTTGNARIADTAFTAQTLDPIPEPSGLPIVAILMGVLIFQVRKWKSRAPLLVAAAMTAGSSQAQLAPRLDITASRPILDVQMVQALPGNNIFSISHVPGALVQILSAGANDVIDLPDAQGNLQGDDTLLATVHVGDGIAPGENESGQLAISLVTLPAPGDKIYARAFNASTIEAATHWGQSILFDIEPLKVMDLSQLGLQATTIPIGAAGDSDADGDGFTDLQELLANTNASDGGDYLVVWSKDEDGIEVRFPGQPGRRYRVERCTNLAEGTWELIGETDLLTLAQEVGIPVGEDVAGCYRVWAIAP
jgi:hypothetical protein